MNKRYLLFTCALLLASQSMYAQDKLSQLYCWLLGNQDVREEYAVLARQALTTLGVHDPQEVPIKQMNGLGPILARVNALSSFTAYGIWLDEAYLDTCSMPERLMHIYHEAAHYAHRHHQKLIMGTMICMPSACAALILLNKLFNVEEKLKYPILAAQMLIAAATTCSYILPEVVKKQEKEADITAAQTLISEGKTDVVIAYINLLKKYVGDRSTFWWPSVAEQIGYLEDVIGSASVG